MIVLALLLPSSGGCAQLKNLKAANAKLEAKNAGLEARLECCGDEKEQARAQLTREKERADEATTELAKALGQAAGQLQRAEVLQQQLAYTQEEIKELREQAKELLVMLEKAWARKGRHRSFVDELLRLERAGAKTVFSFDACNECGAETKGTGP